MRQPIEAGDILLLYKSPSLEAPILLECARSNPWHANYACVNSVDWAPAVHTRGRDWERLSDIEKPITTKGFPTISYKEIHL